MTEFTPVTALIGGALLGLAAVLLLKLNGRIAGISGIVNGALASAAGDRAWRWMFAAGLVSAGLGVQWLAGQPLIGRENFPLPLLIAAGALVGFGTRIGSGCTSGHGVCGLARLSLRSVIATAVFIAVGMLVATAIYTVTVLR